MKMSHRKNILIESIGYNFLNCQQMSLLKYHLETNINRYVIHALLLAFFVLK